MTNLDELRSAAEKWAADNPAISGIHKCAGGYMFLKYELINSLTAFASVIISRHTPEAATVSQEPLSADLQRQVEICEQNGTKWAHFKVSDIHALLKYQAAPRTQPEPKCPKCGSEKLDDRLTNAVTTFVYCRECKYEVFVNGLSDFAQFFLPTPPQPWISVKERLPEAGSTVILCVESEPDSQDIISIVKRNYLGARDNADHDDIIGRGYTHWKELDAQPLPTPPEQGQSK